MYCLLYLLCQRKNFSNTYSLCAYQRINSQKKNNWHLICGGNHKGLCHCQGSIVAESLRHQHDKLCSDKNWNCRGVILTQKKEETSGVTLHRTSKKVAGIKQ